MSLVVSNKHLQFLKVRNSFYIQEFADEPEVSDGSGNDKELIFIDELTVTVVPKVLEKTAYR